MTYVRMISLCIEMSFDTNPMCILEFYRKCHNSEGCIETVILRGNIYSR